MKTEKLFILGIRAANGKSHLAEYLKNSSPDILCLNETKIDEDIVEKEGIFRFNQTLFSTKILRRKKFHKSFLLSIINFSISANHLKRDMLERLF